MVVYFECQDLDATCSALAERGIKFDSPPTDQSWLCREAYLRDPDGNGLRERTDGIRRGGRKVASAAGAAAALLRLRLRRQFLLR